MALQNIGAGNRDDAFYRYKMPKLITKIEGRGNGIKTNVVNMVDVAKALARNPAYTTKYFGCELGAQSKYDEKTGTSIVNGAHDTSKLASLLENFIKKYVQCYGCSNPETEVVITKTQLITLKCAACGYVSDVDMRDKLTTFILKNPPEQKKGGKKDRALRRAEKERLKEGEAADELMKKNKREALKKSKSGSDAKVVKKKTGSDDEEHSPSASQAEEDEAVVDEEEDDVQWQTDTSAEAAKKRIIEQLTAATSEMVMVGNGDDLKESSPKAKTSAKPKTLKKSSSKKSEADNEVNETTEVESPKGEEISPRDKFLSDFKECLMKSMTPAQMAAILNNAEPQSEAMDAFFVALFEGCGKGLHKEISKKKAYLDAVVQDETSQKHLLAAIETFCAALPLNASKEIALLLKVLYDAEILEEEQILLWYDAVPSGKSSANGSGAGSKAACVRKSALPFIDWLRSAEAESEEDED
ncbi:probable eukaryotic translation initiation factor 5-1 [Physcomitrium patens]|uniref:W2 domain-containing protein n=2 Tax=Physcomitrium patens TaxID=3218 RepID=A0A2K1KF63_PHYPA|nr:eukaryotic translation initiation factor 5-like [Physcomitrium patens]PNR52412.1 hypothetical protein PHYPA_008786 [Physcomitrium patens]|eukprot:XP_024377973.1 eukaryotic translation initiation factor 5-like [Physcomitrella patens]